MKKSSTPRISSRKEPQQARSAKLVEAVLEAAAQVLKKEGAARFTTARVAERAGVSVGSLYQYFPGKEAILFRLQSDEWNRTAALLRGILEDQSVAPLDRLKSLVSSFIQTEIEEAELRLALSDAAPLYRNAARAKDGRKETEKVFQRFIGELIPQASSETVKLNGEMLLTTLSAVGRRFSETPRSPEKIEAFSNNIYDVFRRFLEG
ncbi:MAG: TetR family transcriptional regulator [Deltaproteobacteria bacterium]|jgi:AcrR family transcriptional regulator|nr:TetR family transcriptional regulator [Deltaproteobacteria bacterium]